MQSDSHQPSRLYCLDFELEIGLGRGREYPVTVLSSPAGEAHATMHFPFDELALELRLGKLQIALLRSDGKHRRVPSEEEQAVQDLGLSLFEVLFSGRVRTCYDVSLRKAAEEEKGLRLKLRIRPPELSALPWEFLYDPDQKEYVCLSRQTPIVRYLESPRLIRPLTVSPPLRILGMVVSPQDLPVLDIEREKQRVERATQSLRDRGLLELEWLPGQTWRDLQEAMWGGPWHVFHFIGHGGFDARTDEGFIALANRAGHMSRLNATRLGRLLADHNSLRLVLLNACEGARGGKRDVYSSTASILVDKGIPAVVAMQYPITDRAAIEFARAFYRALAYGMAVDEAVVAARKAIDMSVTNTVEWGTPVLYMRSPDGVLFHVAGAPRAKAPAPAPPVDQDLERRLDQRYTAGLSAFWLEDWDEACGHFQAIVDKRPGYQDAVDKLAEARRQKTWSELYEQAHAARRAENWKAAKSALEELVAENPEYKDAVALLEATNRQVRLAGLYAQAQRLHQAQQWQAAVNVFAQIEALDPDYPDPEGLLPAAKQEIAEQVRLEELDDLYSRAVREMDAGRWQEAQGLLHQVQEQEAGYLEAQQLLAKAEAEVAEQKHQAELNALYEEAQAAREAGDWSRAVSALGKLLAEAPDFHGAAAMMDELEMAAPTPGEVRLFGGVEMVYVPAGPFVMGSEEFDDAKPPHEVHVDGFWIDRTPVTNEEYWRFVEAAGDKKPKHWRFGRIPMGKKPHPVVHVSWYDAQEYCHWRSEQAGVEIRLPSEAEWEKAARGTDGRRYPWANKFSNKKCNAEHRDAHGTTPAGRYSPGGDSPYGLVDMAGNVREWTGSLWGRYPYDREDGREDQEDEGCRVLRGGSWYQDQDAVCAAYRDLDGPSDSDDDAGFRCARSGSEP